MPFVQTKPGQYDRPLDDLEIFHRTIGATGARFHRQQYFIIGALKLRNTPSIPDLQQAWTALRHLHPQLATVVDETGTLCRYTVPTPEAVNQWLEETFIVHPEAEYNAPSAEKLALSLPPSPFFKLHWVPASRELLFRTPHWRTDGAGLMMLQDAFLRLLSAPAQEIVFDGSEISCLPPTMNDLLFPGFQATEATQRAFDAEWQATLTDPSLKPLSWVKLALPGTTIPGSTVRVSHRFSKEETTQIITESKKRGITVTNAVASAFLVTAAHHSTPADGRLVLLHPFNLRRYLPAPWNGTAGAGAAYHTGRLQSFNIQDGRDYESACRAVTEFYRRGIDDAFGFMPLLIQGLTSLVDTPAEVVNAGNGSASVDLSQLGRVDDLLQPRYDGSRYTLEIEDWWAGVDFVTKKLQGYTWTRDGRLHLTLHFNEAFYPLEAVEGFLEEWRAVLVKEFVRQ
ncbi:hypothetical protein ASPTUDRAFT_204944 [Aspergillus tubingensis CBS 134.48]|uniref:Phthiocerol/phthiodiolone dimycocerosyl transferase C-terminal domain-containing protein n=1 Tax=Aspergillus tubingensis (strain CBS 134.48) TaxID=767770 RepID=A0A1L9MS29_ASPTC|nr:hypothetical protein ASPTUDRAFT_204944 [Aspergillus tubingensis CBS 134.48]